MSKIVDKSPTFGVLPLAGEWPGNVKSVTFVSGGFSRATIEKNGREWEAWVRLEGGELFYLFDVGSSFKADSNLNVGCPYMKTKGMKNE